LDAHQAVTLDALIAAGVCSKPRDGVKILGQGEIKTKLAFEVAAASKSAVAAIEKAGGSVRLLNETAAAPETA
jgi:large subunit ribosomal protein L15